MRELEVLLGLILAATLLAAAARRVGAPYPVFLALGGALLAFVPGAPSFTVLPELALALFLAPVLLDAAYDASPRDLRDNWAPLTGLAVVAVGLTTIAVAVVARTLMPAMPWAAAIALGAVVAPPDAAAATAVLRQLRPPHRILTILEGESLLNDASALLIYRLAVGAVAANEFSIGAVAPAFLFAVVGSVIVGPARSGRNSSRTWDPSMPILKKGKSDDSPTATCTAEPFRRRAKRFSPCVRMKRLAMTRFIRWKRNWTGSKCLAAGKKMPSFPKLSA
jgi:NhaP-type Na+/H+ or K+/H+ antiporter